MVGCEFGLAGSDEGFESLGLPGFEDFIESEMEDVIDRVELLIGMKTASEFAHDAANATEDAGALEAEIFAVADEGAGFIDEELFEEALRGIGLIGLWFPGREGGEGSDGLEEGGGVIVDGGAFQLQLLQAAVPELLEIVREPTM